MKKNNNGKFRVNSNNSIYNLNYRFDSVSPAGKFSGTALDLIKRYNELAKEASSGGNYVEMEVFRQYAEHYRKIVTEINERKNTYQTQQEKAETIDNDQPQNQEESASENQNETQQESEVLTPKPLPLKRKTLKIVEVKESSEVIPENKENLEKEVTPKPKRTYRRKPKAEPQATAV